MQKIYEHQSKTKIQEIALGLDFSDRASIYRIKDLKSFYFLHLYIEGELIQVKTI